MALACTVGATAVKHSLLSCLLLPNCRQAGRPLGGGPLASTIFMLRRQRDRFRCLEAVEDRERLRTSLCRVFELEGGAVVTDRLAGHVARSSEGAGARETSRPRSFVVLVVLHAIDHETLGTV